MTDRSGAARKAREGREQVHGQKARLARKQSEEQAADDFIAQALANTAKRCQYSWNPGTWPYEKRCDQTATRRRLHPVDLVEINVCDEHYELMATADLIERLDRGTQS